MMMDPFLQSGSTGTRRLASLNKFLGSPKGSSPVVFKRPPYEGFPTLEGNDVLDDLDDTISYELDQFRHGKVWLYGVVDAQPKIPRHGLVIEDNPMSPGAAAVTELPADQACRADGLQRQGQNSPLAPITQKDGQQCKGAVSLKSGDGLAMLMGSGSSPHLKKVLGGSPFKENVVDNTKSQPAETQSHSSGPLSPSLRSGDGLAVLLSTSSGSHLNRLLGKSAAGGVPGYGITTLVYAGDVAALGALRLLEAAAMKVS
eukprot:EG_transcript_20670